MSDLSERAIIPTLILPPRFTQDSNALWRAAIASGWDVERLRGWTVPEGWRPERPVFYGELLFIDAVTQSDAGFDFGTWSVKLLTPAPDWLVYLPDRYRLRRVEFTTLAGLKRFSGRYFVKSLAVKAFPPGVFDLPEGQKNVELWLSGDAEVLVAESVQFEVEYRMFVLDRRVETMSVYLRSGQLAQTKDGEWPAPADEAAEARAFADRLLADGEVDLPEAVVLDVGRIADRGWAVVELNSAWGSGLYGCDPIAALRVIACATVAAPAAD